MRAEGGRKSITLFPRPSTLCLSTPPAPWRDSSLHLSCGPMRRPATGRNRSPALGTAGGRYCLIPDPRMMAEAPTVLLIEDNDDNLRIYSTILTYAGYRVLEATDGEAGLASARTAQPDLILMDVSIPKIDGWEATRILKADPATSSIPVIALTAHALASDRERADQIGFDGYISKPAEPRLVLAEVERRLGKATAGG